MKLVITALALPALGSSPAHAQLEWAAWGTPNGTTNSGSFSTGDFVQLTSFFDGITAGVPAGGEYISDPPIPGVPDGTNPTFQRIVTGSPHPTVLANGATVASLDLTTVDVDTATTFGLADLKSGLWYQLELQDSFDNPLSLAGVRLSHYNLTLTGGVFIADYDLTLNPTTGLILVNSIHEVPTAIYQHSGLTLFDHLPLLTRRIVLKTGRSEDSEGISIYLGIPSTTPVAPTTWGGLKSRDWR